MLGSVASHAPGLDFHLVPNHLSQAGILLSIVLTQSTIARGPCPSWVNGTLKEETVCLHSAQPSPICIHTSWIPQRMAEKPGKRKRHGENTGCALALSLRPAMSPTIPIGLVPSDLLVSRFWLRLWASTPLLPTLAVLSAPF